MKSLASLPLATITLAFSLAPALADDRQVTVYTGAASISLPASALAAPQPTREAGADVAADRKIRVVLASRYRAMN